VHQVLVGHGAEFIPSGHWIALQATWSNRMSVLSQTLFFRAQWRYDNAALGGCYSSIQYSREFSDAIAREYARRLSGRLVRGKSFKGFFVRFFRSVDRIVAKNKRGRKLDSQHLFRN